jgi:phosphatidylethanolamine/phosphatidyl-N-methylethanolamine N-methyltransferase
MSERRRMSAIEEHLVFLGRFLRNPRQIGALAPSSRTLAREMVRHIPLTATTRIVELGPGTGVFTREVIDRLPAGGKFLAVDINAEFCRELRERWPALDCEHGSAADLAAIVSARGWSTVDHIVSGLPFASLPAALSHAILDAVKSTLGPGGTFTTFQYIHAYPTPPARAFRRDMDAHFGPMAARRAVFRNLPPAFVLSWTRPNLAAR